MAATEPTPAAIRLAREFGRGDTYAERVDRVTGLPELIAACEAAKQMTSNVAGWDLTRCQLSEALDIARDGRQ